MVRLIRSHDQPSGRKLVDNFRSCAWKHQPIVVSVCYPSLKGAKFSKRVESNTKRRECVDICPLARYYGSPRKPLETNTLQRLRRGLKLAHMLPLATEMGQKMIFISNPFAKFIAVCLQTRSPLPLLDR